MAAPSGVTLGVDDIAITEDNVSLGIISNTPLQTVGTIEAIGSGVTEWAVNDIVLFDKGGFFTDESANTFAICDKSDVRCKYEAAP